MSIYKTVSWFLWLRRPSHKPDPHFFLTVFIYGLFYSWSRWRQNPQRWNCRHTSVFQQRSIFSRTTNRNFTQVDADENASSTYCRGLIEAQNCKNQSHKFLKNLATETLRFYLRWSGRGKWFANDEARTFLCSRWTLRKRPTTRRSVSSPRWWKLTGTRK